MTTGTDTPDDAVLSPDEAFSVLGNETRLRIIQALGSVDAALSFTELRDRVGIRQGEQFNYHLDKLLGHFVRKSDAGYTLRQPGRRVVQAVLSGTVTDDPVIERTAVEEWPCPYCGGPTELTFRQERVERYCTECSGLYEESAERKVPDVRGGDGDLGYLELPPAGLQDRTPAEVLEAAFTWSYAELLVTGNGVCPRCSAPVEHAVLLCHDHDDSGPICQECGQRYEANFRAECTNYNFTQRGVMSVHLAANLELLSFVTDHGIDPLSEPWNWGWEYEEEIRSRSPFEGRFTFTIDGDSITLAVDENLDVEEVVG